MKGDSQESERTLYYEEEEEEGEEEEEKKKCPKSGRRGLQSQQAGDQKYIN